MTVNLTRYPFYENSNDSRIELTVIMIPPATVQAVGISAKNMNAQIGASGVSSALSNAIFAAGNCRLLVNV